jgi:endonuclease/exonuclease/phosphatase (EEP) superfamily protein YafD
MFCSLLVSCLGFKWRYPTAVAIVFDALPWLLSLAVLVVGLLCLFVAGASLLPMMLMLVADLSFLLLSRCVRRRNRGLRVSLPLRRCSTTKIVFHNVWVDNPSARACAQQLVDSGADVVVVAESSRAFEDLFDSLGGSAKFPFRCGDDLGQRNEYAVTIYSRNELTDVQLAPLCRGVDKTSLVCATLPNGLRVTAANLYACLDAPGFVQRWRLQLIDLCRVLNEQSALSSNLVCVADLNSTSFRPEFSELLLRTGLRDAHAECGRGLSASLSLNGRGPCFARVDHALVDSRTSIDAIEDLPMCGSDHKPFQLSVTT